MKRWNNYRMGRPVATRPGTAVAKPAGRITVDQLAARLGMGTEAGHIRIRAALHADPGRYGAAKDEGVRGVRRPRWLVPAWAVPVLAADLGRAGR